MTRATTTPAGAPSSDLQRCGDSEGGQDRKVVRGRPQVRLRHPRPAGRDTAAEHLDALRGEDRVDALVRIGRGRGVLAAPGGGGPAVLKAVGEQAEGAAGGAVVEVAAGDRVLRAQAGEAVQEHAALFEALVL